MNYGNIAPRSSRTIVRQECLSWLLCKLICSFSLLGVLLMEMMRVEFTSIIRFYHDVMCLKEIGRSWVVGDCVFTFTFAVGNYCRLDLRV